MVVRSTTNNRDDDALFFGFDKKGNDVCMKYCKVLIDAIAESKAKKKGSKTDKEVVDLEREEERDLNIRIEQHRNRKGSGILNSHFLKFLNHND